MTLAMFIVWIAAGQVANEMAVAGLDGWSALLQIPIGVVLAWFMLRAEKKMEEQTKAQRMVAMAIERNSQALMVAVLSMKHMDSNLTDIAKSLSEQARGAAQNHDANTPS